MPTTSLPRNLLLALAAAAAACAAAPEPPPEGQAAQAATRALAPELRARLAHDFLPDAVAGAQTPWGGADPRRWQPEAIVANAASARINAAWKDPSLVDVLVAVPTKLHDSGFNPYGDGQTNSEPTFPFWGESRPPLVATLEVRAGGDARVELDMDEGLHLAQGAVEIAYEVVRGGAKRRLVIPATNQSGRLHATWTPPAELDWTNPGHLTPVFVRPSPGFDDWFPVYFRMPRRSVTDFVATVPPSMRTFPFDGKPILDPEGLAGAASGRTPLQRALAHAFPSFRYNVGQGGAPYVPANVHAELGAGGRPTAVGRGFTWVAERAAPFKAMYTGFDGRDEAAEARHGVPSGSGWHAMGDTITLVNHEEDAPLLAGAGFTNPAIRFGQAPPSGGYAYQLSDVLVLRLLLPGEVFVTSATVFPNRDRDHQWYAIPVGPRDRGFLAEEWVHPTRPVGDNPGFE